MTQEQLSNWKSSEEFQEMRVYFYCLVGMTMVEDNLTLEEAEKVMFDKIIIKLSE